jgi:hypothetical protein
MTQGEIKIIQRKMNNGTVLYTIYIDNAVALITRNKDIILNYQQGKWLWDGIRLKKAVTKQ